MKSRKGTSPLHFALVVTAVTGLAAPAFAQDSPTPTPAAEPAPATHHRASGGAGAGLGVGAAAFVTGVAGPTVVYDFGAWHIEGLLGFARYDANGGPMPPSVTVFDFGVSGWYHLHMGDSSDFSLGGGLGFINASTNMGGGSANATVLEPGAQVRAFITPNVALSARLGLSFVFGDSFGNAFSPGGGTQEGILLGGQFMGGFGFAYYFR